MTEELALWMERNRARRILVVVEERLTASRKRKSKRILLELSVVEQLLDILHKAS